ncbi:hypothetical protein CHARACLAT_020224 [Characodon lateralis]|uniref:Uncharacterized protein n=1 Tax=Characodon lateralis TaxID=208331 RepID=A0ABU7E206_9TELE|nr:hypothetical protein [Characodon lateralis]
MDGESGGQDADWKAGRCTEESLEGGGGEGESLILNFRLNSICHFLLFLCSGRTLHPFLAAEIKCGTVPCQVLHMYLSRLLSCTSIQLTPPLCCCAKDATQWHAACFFFVFVCKVLGVTFWG